MGQINKDLIFFSGISSSNGKTVKQIFTCPFCKDDKSFDNFAEFIKHFQRKDESHKLYKIWQIEKFKQFREEGIQNKTFYKYCNCCGLPFSKNSVMGVTNEYQHYKSK